MEPIVEKNKSCNCAITQSKQGHYVEACKCEFDANMNQKKKTCCRKQRGSCSERSQNPCEKLLDSVAEEKTKPCEPPAPQPTPQFQKFQQPQPVCCSQPTSCSQQHTQTPSRGCTEDPYAAMANCVQQCMNEKSQLAQACGVKCPECPPAKLTEAKDAEAGNKTMKGDKNKKAKGGKGKGKKPRK